MSEIDDLHSIIENYAEAVECYERGDVAAARSALGGLYWWRTALRETINTARKGEGE